MKSKKEIKEDVIIQSSLYLCSVTSVCVGVLGGGLCVCIKTLAKLKVAPVCHYHGYFSHLYEATVEGSVAVDRACVTCYVGYVQMSQH